MSTNGKKVIVGLSGGVDSSVSALLLKQQGYLVEGLFMKNWEADDEDEYCTAQQDLADAQAVCSQLQIPLHAVNFSKQYWDKVFAYFLKEYQAGRTPNPDVLCNKEIKFTAFLKHALQLGADFIATGHYAHVVRRSGQMHLYKSEDPDKDQTYFLYLLNQHQLAKTLFPLACHTKIQVRALAQQHNLITHAKKDSTGICFIGERKFKEFLEQYLPAKPGSIETPTGTVVGRHSGLMFYTIGQRQGLHIGGRSDSVEAPWYVAGKDVQRNVLIVVQGQHHPLLYASTLLCDQVHWVSGTAPFLPLSCTAKIRYRQSEQPCTITQHSATQLYVTFDSPQRAITAGQSVVFYCDNDCLGGGIITN